MKTFVSLNSILSQKKNKKNSNMNVKYGKFLLRE